MDSFVLRARLALPIVAPPIEDAALWIHHGLIQAIGPWNDLHPHLRAPVVDLGNVAILPGLVNAHCHLDYTTMAGELPPPRHFSDWIKGILAAKSTRTRDDFRQSWLQGAAELTQTGATTAANMEAFPDLLPDVRPYARLRILSYIEMTGIRSQRSDEEILALAEQHLQNIPEAERGLSPHAAYSTRPDLLQRTAAWSKSSGRRISSHVAESVDEFEMFMYRRGPMFHWLSPQRSMDDCGAASPVRHFVHLGLHGPSFLAVHVNYLWHGDADILAKTHTPVVHCPRSHAFFKHQRFPRAELEHAGVLLCLGTDSLASVRSPRGATPILSLWDEMRAALAVDSQLAPLTLLRQTTTDAARALQIESLTGALAPGLSADLALLQFDGPTPSAPETLVHQTRLTAATLYRGQWVWIDPHQGIPTSLLSPP